MSIEKKNVQLTDKYSLTHKSKRTVDANGFLHVKDNKIAKAGVYKYLGRELGKDLIPNKVYYVYKPYEEIRKAITDTQLPVHALHEWVTPENKTDVHGSLTGMKEGEPFIEGDLTLYKQDAIDMVNKGKCELSMGFTCDLEAEEGEFEGQHYDFIQTNINFNHIAIVPEGRCGSEVRINDERGVLMDEKIQIKDSPIVGDADIEKSKEASRDEKKAPETTEQEKVPGVKAEPQEKEKDKKCGKDEDELEKEKAEDEDETEEVKKKEDEEETEETSEEKKVGDMSLKALVGLAQKEGLSITIVDSRPKEQTQITDADVMKRAVQLVSDSYKALDEVAPYVGKFEVITNDSVMTVDEVYKHALRQVGFVQDTTDPKGVFSMYLQTKGVSKRIQDKSISTEKTASEKMLESLKERGF